MPSWRARRGRDDRDRGETLLELIIAIAILGVCVVAIGSGIAMSITISVLHRNQATAQDALHNYAETLQGSYVACTGSTVPGYGQSLDRHTPRFVPSNWPAPTAVVEYWLPGSAAFSTTCPPGGDTGLQQVALTQADATGKVSESLVVDIRSGS
jgi:type II secretory pathway pseudopilin PulG